jgi:hypothetical protein
MKKFIIFFIFIPFICVSSELLRFVRCKTIINNFIINNFFVPNINRVASINNVSYSHSNRNGNKFLFVDDSEKKIEIHTDGVRGYKNIKINNNYDIESCIFSPSGSQILVCCKKVENEFILRYLYLLTLEGDNDNFRVKKTVKKRIKYDEFISCNFLYDDLVVVNINYDGQGYMLFYAVLQDSFYRFYYLKKNDPYSSRNLLRVSNSEKKFTDDLYTYSYLSLLSWYLDRGRFILRAEEFVNNFERVDNDLYRNRAGYLSGI